MKTPAALACHLAAHLPAAWTAAEMPRGMRRRYGARLTVGDCCVYVAASLALDPTTAPTWAKVTT